MYLAGPKNANTIIVESYFFLRIVETLLKNACSKCEISASVLLVQMGGVLLGMISWCCSREIKRVKQTSQIEQTFCSQCHMNDTRLFQFSVPILNFYQITITSITSTICFKRNTNRTTLFFLMKNLSKCAVKSTRCLLCRLNEGILSWHQIVLCHLLQKCFFRAKLNESFRTKIIFFDAVIALKTLSLFSFPFLSRDEKVDLFRDALFSLHESPQYWKEIIKNKVTFPVPPLIIYAFFIFGVWDLPLLMGDGLLDLFMAFSLESKNAKYCGYTKNAL